MLCRNLVVRSPDTLADRPRCAYNARYEKHIRDHYTNYMPDALKPEPSGKGA